MMKRINLDRHQLWVVGGNMASKYLRGNCLGMLPSTCRKPICLRLLEVLSYSCTPAAPAQDQALAGLPAARGWPEPLCSACPLLAPPPGRRPEGRGAPAGDALQIKRNPNFRPGVWRGKDAHSTRLRISDLPCEQANPKRNARY